MICRDFFDCWLRVLNSLFSRNDIRCIGRFLNRLSSKYFLYFRIECLYLLKRGLLQPNRIKQLYNNMRRWLKGRHRSLR
jgi:hypothetical protein